ncbi:YggT family protein [Nocardioides sp. W7]|uniref:YggT family protein n=1 Tax=Nocardioides sp. W7 TaxID=2931390 RepID=UPI001FD2EC1D|nr:YggT family protein [Nocardioides sp. W7]
MEAVGNILLIVLYVFFGMLWIRFIVDWVQMFARGWSPHGALLLLLEVVYTTTDPPIRALRRVIPPLRLGSIALDVSFLIVMISTYVLIALVRSSFGG